MSRTRIITPPSIFPVHTLPVSLSVLSQLQMRAQAFTGLAAMHGFRYPRELSEHTHNYRVYHTLSTANLRDSMSLGSCVTPNLSASHTCLLWILLLALLVACDAATIPVKTWGLNTRWRRAVLAKGESEFALQERNSQHLVTFQLQGSNKLGGLLSLLDCLTCFMGRIYAEKNCSLFMQDTSLPRYLVVSLMGLGVLLQVLNFKKPPMGFLPIQNMWIERNGEVYYGITRFLTEEMPWVLSRRYSRW